MEFVDIFIERRSAKMEDITKTNEKPMEDLPLTQSVTSSGDSETLDTWTVITSDLTGKEKETEVVGENVETLENQESSDSASGIEVLHVEDLQSKSSEEIDHIEGDLSDGISIISESESAGRVSPIALVTLRSTLSQTYNFSSAEEEFDIKDFLPLTPPNTPRVYESGEVPPRIGNLANIHGIDLTNSNSNASTNSSSNGGQGSAQNRSLLSPGLPTVFYCSVFVALVAFFGRLRMPDLDKGPQPLDEAGLTPLVQRIQDLETTNTFLRAELDKLTERFREISETTTESPAALQQDIKDAINKMQKEQEAQGPPKKRIKVWHGGSDEFMGPMKIPSKKYQLPTYCYNSEGLFSDYDEEACMGFLEKIAFIDFQQKKKFEEAEKIGSVKIQSSRETGKESEDAVVEDETLRPEDETPKPKVEPPKNERSHEKLQKPYVYEKQQKFERKDQRRFEGKENRDPDRKYDSREQKERDFRKYDKENSHKDSRKDDGKKNDFKKYDARNPTHENYKENSRKHDRGEVKEKSWNEGPNEYEKQKNAKYRREVFRDGSGSHKHYDHNDWHEQMMNHREEIRRKSNGKYDDENSKNWYFERSEARKDAREMPSESHEHNGDNVPQDKYHKKYRKFLSNVSDKVRRIQSKFETYLKTKFSRLLQM